MLRHALEVVTGYVDGGDITGLDEVQVTTGWAAFVDPLLRWLNAVTFTMEVAECQR